MGQTWRHLLFAHWRVDPDELRAVVPPELPIDVRDGAAWVGVTPFLVEGFHLHGLPPPPLLGTFREVNVRTYVTVGGKPGIYFLSLDASSRLAAFAARRTYRLPYFHTQMSLEPDGEGFRALSRRTSRDGPRAELDCAYEATGARLPEEPDSLERWLTERYCLYTLDGERVLQRGEILHGPWPLQPAAAEIASNTMAAGFGLSLEGDPLLHYSERQDVVLWTIEPVAE
jgi:uncharacterized protein